MHGNMTQKITLCSCCYLLGQSKNFAQFMETKFHFILLKNLPDISCAEPEECAHGLSFFPFSIDVSIILTSTFTFLNVLTPNCLRIYFYFPDLKIS